MGKRAYIAGNLDGAFLFENGRATLVQGKSNTSFGDIDNYMLSQIFASNPEITEVDYSSMDDLRAKIETEHEKQEALGMALELMDTTLSENYRKEIAVLLSAELNEKPYLFTFIQNRFLATPLPEGFNPQAAREIAGEVSDQLMALYENLEEKAGLFAAFYTQLIMQLGLEADEMELLDLMLTDNGCYAAFTKALYEESREKWKEAVDAVLPVLEQLNIVEKRKLFDVILEQLSEVHGIALTNRKQELLVNRAKVLQQKRMEIIQQRAVEKFGKVNRSNQKLVNLVKQLHYVEHNVIVLFYFDRLRYNEIAEIMNCSPSAVVKALARARKNLREIMANDQAAQPDDGFNQEI